ncbi:MAG: UvrD-helicase domain-containing protein [Oscillospiraceae bacterium]|nr:UvrD-helicase domain-containing protein [Oscillospiraceae bacterium]
MPQWTDEQLSAINAAGGAVIVSAAAGSGKTAVLIEKLKRILTDTETPISADRIIVVTFTNDAAAQMKQRLSDALSAELENDPENQYIAGQLELLPKAKISTISAFCFDLIRDNIGSVSVDPGFRIADQGEEDILVQKALDELIEEQLAPSHPKNAEITALIDFFSPNQRSVRRFAAVAAELRDKLLSQPFCEEYLDNAAQMYSGNYKEHPLYKFYCEELCRQLETAAKAADEFAALIDRYMAPEYTGAKEPNPYMKMRDEVTFVIKYLEKVMANPEIGHRTPVFINENGDKTFGTFTATKIKSEDIREQCKLMRNLYKSIIAGGAKSIPKNAVCSPLFANPDDIRTDMEIHAKYCQLLSGFMKDLDKKVAELKAEKNVLVFSDGERLAVELLCEKSGDKIVRTPLAKELSEYYDIIMIDEFQDSNRIQSLIFNLLSKNGSADNPGTNLFAVGDVKQSIYRFRNAEPDIFLDRLASSVPCDEAKDGQNRCVLLNKNFRSSIGVIDFVNDVFSAVMSPNVGGLVYDKSHRLVKGSAIEGDFDTELIITEYEKGSEDKGAQLEAKAVAARIKKLLAENPDVKASDICLLFRGRRYMSVFAAALTDSGISACCDSSENLLDTREASALINLLRAVDNASSDIPMAAALMSDMFMFTAENMTEAAYMTGSSLYAKIRECALDEADVSEELREKAKGFCRTFEDIRGFAAQGTTEQLVRYIYDRTDFLQIVSVYPDGALRKANLLLLAKTAAQYDSSGGSGQGLSGFIRQINIMREKGEELSGATPDSGGGESVTIKTIHSSKGLEYPYVFLCRLNTEFSGMDQRAPLIFSAEYGAAFNISDSKRFTTYDSFPRKIMKSVKRSSNINEEMMLLYVAMTRAKNQLFVSLACEEGSTIDAFGKGDNISSAYSAENANSMADWITCALSRYVKACDDKGNIYLHLGEHKVRMTYPTMPAADERAAEAPANTDNGTPLPTADEETALLFEKKLAYGKNYPLELSQTPAKLSVSEIAEKYVVADENAPPAPRGRNYYLAIPKGMSAAEVGTAVHAFMQFADLMSVADAPNIRERIALHARELGQRGIITPEQAKCAVPEVIEPFFATDLWQRMANSAEILREKKFLVKITDLMLDDKAFTVYNGSMGMLQGVVDCLFRESDGWVLVDYKTDRNVSGNILMERYKNQLLLYARAFSIILDMPVKEAFIYSFALGKEIPANI